MTTHWNEIEKEFDEKFGTDQYGKVEPFRQDKVLSFFKHHYEEQHAMVVKDVEKLSGKIFISREEVVNLIKKIYGAY